MPKTALKKVFCWLTTIFPPSAEKSFGSHVAILPPDHRRFVQYCCRSPHGERGLKWSRLHHARQIFCRRSPHGERGLKCYKFGGLPPCNASLPARGAWIEIGGGMSLTYAPETSLPARGAWIEIKKLELFCENPLSRSPHGERGLKSASEQHLYCH